MRLRTLARRTLLSLVGLQAVVIAVISVIDSLRKRHHTHSTFPRTDPVLATIGTERVTTYCYGADLYADMLAAIRGAQRTVHFESFIWKNDAVGQGFKVALQEAADRGVEVFVIYDGFANLVVPASFKRFPPSMHVIEYPVFAPGWRFFDPRRYGRDHRKILVVDGEVGFVGGYNVGSMYAAQWRDTHVRIEGPSAWDLKNAFVDFWNLNRTKHQPELHDPGTSSWEARIRVYRNLPRMRMFPIRGMYLEALDRAQHHILLTHAYFIPDAQILAAMLIAANRGVDVRLLLPATSNHVVADWVSRGFYAPLLRGGVRIFLYENAMVHAKTATIDSEWSTVGTANVDRLSLTGNYEINVEFFSPELAEHMEKVFATDCGNARELTLHEWEQRPLVAKLSERVLAPLAPLL
ncbi:MAG TPA: phosphatidylserine/phosphatidylglycerophosphate/cardiolipin synthase family protein [Nocardioidaceae bacterium]|nr:phosphatidylserine/phosphatidylglycerophosphate/cardiolipin synthase family protein [Nocardioidaceae bacterium]